ncbi:GNAT family N-acetyltransferase [Vibrio sp. D404a]|uniref:GNAT family N-acetyltransferase n=1 Tax=unclassified Vibrio TaxID=2614977 RepID=UPI002554B274|nr:MULTISPECIES: GNAT family N-acetyltransferase [unclassified Vibrio]MDK9739083.1 GNAT family N-acetyltransferase [Vibrio sp. D404a]MDK9796592.1 GNAT family N-acetyltransferase [Vibrio sp. D449a]
MEIKVRRTEPSDARSVKEIFECPNAFRGTLQLPHPSLDLWEKRLTHVPEHVYSYVALYQGEVIGNLGLEVCVNPRRRHVASLGMGVKDNYAGKGVGSALLQTAVDLCDNWINIKRLELTVYTDNEQAINLYKKFGFQIEGESAAFAFRDGEYVAVYHMARIKTS